MAKINGGQILPDQALEIGKLISEHYTVKKLQSGLAQIIQDTFQK